MEEFGFLLTFIAVLFLSLFIGDFSSGALSGGSVGGIVLAVTSYLGVHYYRHGKLI